MFRGNWFWVCWGRLAGDTSAFTFSLNCWRFFNILMCVRQEFDSDGDFKWKVGDEAEVVGKIQNYELSTVQKCFIFIVKIEYLTVLGCHRKAKMTWNIGICKVWVTCLKSYSKSISGSQIGVQNVVVTVFAFALFCWCFLKIPACEGVQFKHFGWFSIGFTDVSWKLISGMLGPLGRQHVSVHILFKLLTFC